MKKILVLLIATSTVFSGRTSQWSPVFTVSEATIIDNHHRNDAVRSPTSALKVVALPLTHTVTLSVLGATGNAYRSLKIFAMNGQLVADLSGALSSGQTSVVWNTSLAHAGLFFAVLQSNQGSTIVKFMLVK